MTQTDDSNDMIECRSCGEEVERDCIYQGRCDACEDMQMVRSIR